MGPVPPAIVYFDYNGECAEVNEPHAAAVEAADEVSGDAAAAPDMRLVLTSGRTGCHLTFTIVDYAGCLRVAAGGTTAYSNDMWRASGTVLDGCGAWSGTYSPVKMSGKYDVKFTEEDGQDMALSIEDFILVTTPSDRRRLGLPGDHTLMAFAGLCWHGFSFCALLESGESEPEQ